MIVTQTIRVCAVEKGLPFLGVTLDVLRPEYELELFFEKHGSDAINLNLGPSGGWILALQTVEDLQECSISKGKDMYTKWPGGDYFYHSSCMFRRCT